MEFQEGETLPGSGGRGAGGGEAPAEVQEGLFQGWKGLHLSCVGGDTADYTHQTSLTLQLKGSISAHGHDGCKKLI